MIFPQGYLGTVTAARNAEEDRGRAARAENLRLFNEFIKNQRELGIEPSAAQLIELQEKLTGGNPFTSPGFGQQNFINNVVNAQREAIANQRQDRELSILGKNLETNKQVATILEESILGSRNIDEALKNFQARLPDSLKPKALEFAGNIETRFNQVHQERSLKIADMIEKLKLNDPGVIKQQFGDTPSTALAISLADSRKRDREIQLRREVMEAATSNQQFMQLYQGGHVDAVKPFIERMAQDRGITLDQQFWTDLESRSRELGSIVAGNTYNKLQAEYVTKYREIYRKAREDEAETLKLTAKNFFANEGEKAATAMATAAYQLFHTYGDSANAILANLRNVQGADKQDVEALKQAYVRQFNPTPLAVAEQRAINSATRAVMPYRPGDFMSQFTHIRNGIDQVRNVFEQARENMANGALKPASAVKAAEALFRELSQYAAGQATLSTSGGTLFGYDPVRTDALNREIMALVAEIEEFGKTARRTAEAAEPKTRPGDPSLTSAVRSPIPPPAPTEVDPASRLRELLQGLFTTPAVPSVSVPIPRE